MLVPLPLLRRRKLDLENWQFEISVHEQLRKKITVGKAQKLTGGSLNPFKPLYNSKEVVSE